MVYSRSVVIFVCLVYLLQTDKRHDSFVNYDFLKGFNSYLFLQEF